MSGLLPLSSFQLISQTSLPVLPPGALDTRPCPHPCLLFQRPRLVAKMATSRTRPWRAPRMKPPQAALSTSSSRLSRWEALYPGWGPQTKR